MRSFLLYLALISTLALTACGSGNSSNTGNSSNSGFSSLGGASSGVSSGMGALGGAGSGSSSGLGALGGAGGGAGTGTSTGSNTGGAGTGGGNGNLAGSCTLSSSSYTICMEYYGVNQSVVDQSCSTQGGASSASGCSLTNVMGKCRTDSITTYYDINFGGAANMQSACTQFGGTWTAL